MFIVGPVSVQCTDYMAIILLKSATTSVFQSFALFLHEKGCFFTLRRGNSQGNKNSLLFLRIVVLRLGRI